MIIALLILGSFAVTIGVFMLSDGFEPGFLVIVIGVIFIFMAGLIKNAPDYRYDVHCGEATYANVELVLEGDYLKIIDGRSVAYENGPCDWTLIAD